MASSEQMSTTTSTRLMHDYAQLKKDPLPYVLAEFHPTNIYEWHFVVRGLENTLLMGGFFHGKLIFPQSYPFQPPEVLMITPLNCFKPESWNSPTAECSFSPEAWSPAMSVRSILTGVVWNMFSNPKLIGTSCANIPLDLSTDHAKQSNKANLENGDFCKLFPSIVGELLTAKVTSQHDDLLLSDLDDEDDVIDDDDVHDFNFLLR